VASPQAFSASTSGTLSRCDAKLRITDACIEGIDFQRERQLEKAVVRQLATCRWVSEHQTVIATGATGTGKSYFACALAHQACRKGFRALYRRVPRLFDELRLARADGTYQRLLTRFAKLDVLVLDDFASRHSPRKAAATFWRSSKTAMGYAPR
jgi:DNA replication protein DnaC